MMARAPVKQAARLREICRQNPLQSRQKNAATPVAPVCQNTPAAAVQGQGRKPLRGLAQRPKAICRSMVGKRANSPQGDEASGDSDAPGYFRQIDAATPSARPPTRGKAHSVSHILRKTLCAGAPDAGQCWPRIGCPCSGTACNPFVPWMAGRRCGLPAPCRSLGVCPPAGPLRRPADVPRHLMCIEPIAAASLAAHRVLSFGCLAAMPHRANNTCPQQTRARRPFQGRRARGRIIAVWIKCKAPRHGLLAVCLRYVPWGTGFSSRTIWAQAPSTSSSIARSK